ncbi:MAG: CDP-glycerol glycerophosphotransferase family protein [Spirochaetales bacterium]|nr:CDP-glycerol glycerophosphotransferase family protein [Spirochaetales bacterium]
MNPLYIDPGTGSALFSIAVGLATTVYFFSKHFWVWLKGRFARASAVSVRVSGGERARIVLHSEGARYWNVFKPVVEELERRGVEARYLSMEESDPGLSSGHSRLKPSYIGTGDAAWARMRMLEADVCLTTTPGLDVYQFKRSRGVGHYAHILHAVDDATSYRLFGLDYFDSVLLSGDYQSAAIRELEARRGLPAKALRVVGSTYLDVYAQELKTLAAGSRDGTTVLVSPSWGPSGILARHGMRLLEPLARSGLELIVRPHPQSVKSETSMLDELRASLEPYANVEWDFGRENLGSLSRADVMISDFSGIIFDYAFLFGRPVLHVAQDFDPRPYDASDVGERPWKFRTVERIGRKLDSDDFPGIAELVASVRSDPMVAAAIAEAREEAWCHRGEAGARVADFLMELSGSTGGGGRTDKRN